MTGPGRQQHPLYGPHQPQPRPTATPTHQPPKAPSTRGPLIIAAAIVSAAIAISTVLVITRSDDERPTAATARQSGTAPTAPTLVRADPSTLLPTTDQVRAATLIDPMSPNPPTTKVRPDTATTPPQCAIAASPTSQSVWGAAVSTASQKFGDSVDKAQPISFAGTAVAVFDTTDDAFDSFNKVIASVHGCTGYTASDDSTSGSSSWTISNIRPQDSRLMWTDSESAAASPWKCAKTYRAQANVASFVIVCGSNPSDASAKLADQIITTATKH